MIDRKIIFFSDLEGTILRESDGNFDDKDFYDLISELSKLGNVTNSTIEIRLVSPVGFKKMDLIIDRMENILVRHSKLTNSGNVKLIEAAASSYDLRDEFFAPKVSNKITELPKTQNGNPNGAQEQKRRYVKLVVDTENDTQNVPFLYIYAGNGRNDITAMKSLKSVKNNFIICPKNSRTAIKQMADFVSEKTDILGIIDGIHEINKKIRERRIDNSKRNINENCRRENEQI